MAHFTNVAIEFDKETLKFITRQDNGEMGDVELVDYDRTVLRTYVCLH